jgi:hypothetical protein
MGGRFAVVAGLSRFRCCWGCPRSFSRHHRNGHGVNKFNNLEEFGLRCLGEAASLPPFVSQNVPDGVRVNAEALGLT